MPKTTTGGSLSSSASATGLGAAKSPSGSLAFPVTSRAKLELISVLPGLPYAVLWLCCWWQHRVQAEIFACRLLPMIFEVDLLFLALEGMQK